MGELQTAEQFVLTGAAGAMFDHWTVLQFLDRQTGQFIPQAVDVGFQLVGNKLLRNFTTQIKGWVGPVIEQRGIYPPNFTPVCCHPAAQIEEAHARLYLLLLPRAKRQPTIQILFLKKPSCQKVDDLGHFWA